MLPSKFDPRWAKIANNPDAYKDKVSSLPTRLMLGALKIKVQREPLASRIDHAYDFFVKNQQMVANDIKALFS
jgi:hypothetical protein